MKQITLEQLRTANTARCLEWLGQANTLGDLPFCTVELGGEVGEFQNFVKKYLRGLMTDKGGISLEDLRVEGAKELADILICVDRAAESLGIDLNKALVDKFNETSDKHQLDTKL